MQWTTPKHYFPWERQPWMPPTGTVRVRTSFAFFPVDCNDQKTRWLEKIDIVEEFGKRYQGLHGSFRWDWVKLYVTKHNPNGEKE